MSNEEAINALEFVCSLATALDTKGLIKKAKDIAVDALRKQEPVKPDYHTCGAGDYWSCPKCGYRGINDVYGNYCSECGQLIGWGDDSEETNDQADTSK